MGSQGVRKGVGGMVVGKGVTFFWNQFSGDIVWHSQREWRAMRGTWNKISSAVGAMDETSHEIYRPKSEPQIQFYSGHRHYHCIHTLLVVDTHGFICFVQSGFMGHQNDATSYQLLSQIGPREALDFPADCNLLADKIFPNTYPLLTPYTSQQIRRQQPHIQHKSRKFNRILNRFRISVEHAIGYMKRFRCISTLWRHPRWKLSMIVEICEGLSNRHKKLF